MTQSTPFVWEPSQDQIYSQDLGSQTLTDGSFDKAEGKEFTMGAAGCELVMNVTDKHTQESIWWFDNSKLNVEAGTFTYDFSYFISSPLQAPLLMLRGINAGVKDDVQSCFKIKNPRFVNILGDIEIKNNGILSVDSISEEFYISSAASKVNLSENAQLFISRVPSKYPTVGINGDVSLDGKSQAVFNLFSLENEENTSYTVKGNSTISIYSAEINSLNLLDFVISSGNPKISIGDPQGILCDITSFGEVVTINPGEPGEYRRAKGRFNFIEEGKGDFFGEIHLHCRYFNGEEFETDPTNIKYWLSSHMMLCLNGTPLSANKFDITINRNDDLVIKLK